MLLDEVAQSGSVDELYPAFSVALVQQPLANQDVVTRMPRPARFSSIAPTSSRIWLTPMHSAVPLSLDDR